MRAGGAVRISAGMSSVAYISARYKAVYISVRRRVQYISVSRGAVHISVKRGQYISVPEGGGSCLAVCLAKQVGRDSC